MKISKQGRRTAKQLLRCCLSEGVLDESRVRKTVDIMIEKKPRGYFGILSHFQRLVGLEVAKRSARVESSVPMTPEIQAAVESGLTGRYGKGLAISYHTNPELMGGLRIQVGSDVYDGSLAARLKGLQDSF